MLFGDIVDDVNTFITYSISYFFDILDWCSYNNKLEFVEEEKLEARCDINIVKKVLKRLREVHPYEEPAIDIIPLIDEENYILVLLKKYYTFED